MQHANSAAAGRADHLAASPWLKWAGVLLAGAGYAAFIGLAAQQAVGLTDMDYFFWPAARIALAGRPLQVYAVHLGESIPNANGPVSLLPLVAVAAVAAQLGWSNDLALRHLVVTASFAPFSLLLAREGGQRSNAWVGCTCEAWHAARATSSSHATLCC